MSKYTLVASNGQRSEFLDPERLASGLMASVQRQKKVIGGISLRQINSVVASTVALSVPKPSGCDDACVIMPNENLSIRTTISGSAENSDAVKVLLTSHIAALNALTAGLGLTVGFINNAIDVTAPDFNFSEV